MRCTENDKLKLSSKIGPWKQKRGPTLTCPEIKVRNNHNFLRQKLIISAPLSLNYASQAAIILKINAAWFSYRLELSQNNEVMAQPAH